MSSHGLIVRFGCVPEVIRQWLWLQHAQAICRHLCQHRHFDGSEGEDMSVCGWPVTRQRLQTGAFAGKDCRLGFCIQIRVGWIAASSAKQESLAFMSWSKRLVKGSSMIV